MNALTNNTVLIANNPNDAQVTKQVLGTNGSGVSQFGTLAEFHQALGTSRNGGALLAVMAGADSSVVQSRQIATFCHEYPTVPVIVATTSVDVPTAVEIMKQGASDVVPLMTAPDEVRARVEQALNIARSRAEAATERNELRTRLATLTKAEIDVLDMLLDGMANKQISQALGIGLRTVELRRSKIMKKMQANSIAQLIKMVCIARGISTVGGEQ